MVTREAGWEQGDTSSFSYPLIAPHAFGNALPGCSYKLMAIDRDLWAAFFSYESDFEFQA